MHKAATQGDSRNGTFLSLPTAPSNSLPHINSDRPRALFGRDRMKFTKLTGNARKDFSRDAYEKILKQQTLLQTAVQIVLLEQVDRKTSSAGEFSGGIMQFFLTGWLYFNSPKIFIFSYFVLFFSIFFFLNLFLIIKIFSFNHNIHQFKSILFYSNYSVLSINLPSLFFPYRNLSKLSIRLHIYSIYVFLLNINIFINDLHIYCTRAQNKNKKLI